LQILFESSDEAPRVKGLGLVKGHVKRFGNDVKVPHMGWNQVEQMKASQIFKGIGQAEYFYFVHSYYPEPGEDVIATKTDYGSPFCFIHREGEHLCMPVPPGKKPEGGLALPS